MRHASSEATHCLESRKENEAEGWTAGFGPATSRGGTEPAVPTLRQGFAGCMIALLGVGAFGAEASSDLFDEAAEIANEAGILYNSAMPYLKEAAEVVTDTVTAAKLVVAADTARGACRIEAMSTIAAERKPVRGETPEEVGGALVGDWVSNCSVALFALLDGIDAVVPFPADRLTAMAEYASRVADFRRRATLPLVTRLVGNAREALSQAAPRRKPATPYITREEIEAAFQPMRDRFAETQAILREMERDALRGTRYEHLLRDDTDDGRITIPTIPYED